MQQSQNTTSNTCARTIEDAAKSIGISRAGLYSLTGEKQIRALKIGHRTLIADSELRRFIAERMEAAA